jgi:hypothetical protein
MAAPPRRLARFNSILYTAGSSRRVQPQFTRIAQHLHGTSMVCPFLKRRSKRELTHISDVLGCSAGLGNALINALGA